ncbi:hypothetical protein KP509_21G082900 [Ceratopteris richardii]|uniref:Uncharacterized protein n=1 Tax=Ceratopteris richardii TaxID=49495 RepID=A0A8T2SFP4_CERRI|nr:hypothetical protein KP509_21G082900 [Ceratopteris richardii]
MEKRRIISITNLSLEGLGYDSNFFICRCLACGTKSVSVSKEKSYNITRIPA